METLEQSWADPEQRQGLCDFIQSLNDFRTYATYDDWSLPVGAEYRLAGSTAVLKKYCSLNDYRDQDETTGKYDFDQDRLNAVKKTIASGHAVGCEIYGDGGTDLSVFNKENWAQYISTDDDEYSSIMA